MNAPRHGSGSPQDRGTSPAPQAAPLAALILVTGKGGVGKTTIAAGLAQAAVAEGTEATLIEFGDGASGRRALGDARVEHLVIAPGAAITRAASPLFGGGLLARAVLGNFAVKRLLEAAPAVRELAMLECVRMAAEARRGRRVVVDMPASGHGLAWLRVPGQLSRLIESGPLFDLTSRLNHFLVVPGRSSIVVVTLAEPLVLAETLELCASMQRELGRNPARLVVNRVPAEVAAGAISEARALARGGGETAIAAAELAAVLEARAALRAEALAALGLSLGEGGPGVGAGSVAPVLLPEAPRDPTADVVAAWLRSEGVT